MSEVKETLKSPLRQALDRFVANKPAVFGLFVIILSILVMASGTLFLRDKTPDANNGDTRIHKKPPGYKVKVLKFIKDRDIDQVGFFTKLYWGQEDNYTIVPVEEFAIEGNQIKFVNCDRRKSSETATLIKAMRRINNDPPAQLRLDSIANFVVEGDQITYISPDNKVVSESLSKLKKEFETQLVEERYYPLGTDALGADMLSRLMLGTRVSLLIGFLAVLISMLIGVPVGALAGYMGGRVDALFMWLMTVVWSIPSIMLVIVISLALGSKEIWVIFVAVGFTMWGDVARVVRGQMLSIKEKLFIEAAKAFGMGNGRIIFKHVMPNITAPIIVTATANFASAILIEAGLSFLGLGVQPPTPSWGQMVHEGFKALGSENSLHLILLPSICIWLLVLSFNLLGNGIKDAFLPSEGRKF
ncbi:MAG: ABC transporter permease [Cytophagales bacterium]|nr:MAG: ABC transporter permease [Cytophagales bacterium]TAF60967.1 MAG: ABC transporter permease [Cytophagales bacterium]